MIRIPSPPSANKMYRNVPGVGTIKSKAYRQWQIDVGWLIKQKPVTSFGQMLVEVKIWVPRFRKRDADNFLKPIGDALQLYGIVKNDSQIERWIVERHDDKDALVEVMPFSESHSMERRVEAARSIA
jgi:Holliday junction resolvase RusA-like endonuclease